MFQKLLEAYSDKNLNRISAKIIALYKAKQHDTIRDIARNVDVHDEQISKCFSKLIMKYHPDKGNVLRKEIEELKRNNDENSAQQYSHIFLLNDVEKLVVEPAYYADCDYAPEYVYDFNFESEGFQVFSEDQEADFKEGLDPDLFNAPPGAFTFYDAVKMKMYGNTEIEMPPYYLEDFEEIEMAECQIDDLDGIAYCFHGRIFELSRNEFVDISEMRNLKRTEELYLADNKILDIEALALLPRLRILDLSNNPVDDITPLLSLKYLDYVNLVGCKVSPEQISKLKVKVSVVLV